MLECPTDIQQHTASLGTVLGKELRIIKDKNTEEENLNKGSGEDEEMYSWDELEYKVNYVCFISSKSTEQQV